MKVQFVKMHGTGNDFVIVDEWAGEVIAADAKPDFVRTITNRHFGVGADGVIFLLKSKKFDARMLIYNSDGSRADMSGNGIRCLAKYFYDSGYVTVNEIAVETPVGAKNLLLTLFNEKVEQVRVDMGEPQIKRGAAQVSGNPDDTFINQELSVDGVSYKVTSVGLGTPHAVLIVDDAKAADVRGVGRKIRNMREVFPNGVNVHFIQKRGANEFIIRSYERGVEDETLACGTGICASAVAASLNKIADPAKTFKFHARGGDVTVKLEWDGEKVKRAFLKGPVAEVYGGEFEYDPKRTFENAAGSFITNVLSP